ncbi:MAG TPA: hypothetical protein VNJ47_05315, partial [Nevskiales bacterium]|nr:hypothetical protein [Nevskiales bacterium]
ARPGPYVMARSAWILRQMGYGPRPAPAGDDPEPIEPEAIGPDGSDESADGATPPEPGSLPEEGLPEEGLPEEPAPVHPVPAENAPAPAGAMDVPAQPASPGGGGRVIDEAPDEDVREWEQSLIL